MGQKKVRTQAQKTQAVINRLRDKFNLNVVDEIIKMYLMFDKMAQPLVDRILENVKDGRHLYFGIDELELESLGQLNKDKLKILTTILGYCHPKQKAVEVRAGAGESATFNVTMTPVKDEDVEVKQTKQGVLSLRSVNQ